MNGRRKFTKGVVTAAALAAVGGRAHAQTPILGRLSHHLNTTHFIHKAVSQFAEEVKQRTNGGVVIEIFPTGQLYKGDDTPQALIQGNLDLALTTDNYWQQFVPEIDVLSLPFLFKDPEAVRRNIIGGFGTELGRIMEGKVPIKVLGQMEFGPADVWVYKGSRTIKVPTDFRGMKVRAPWESVEKFITASGGQPVNIPSTDVFIALQQGTVDGTLSNAPGILARKWNEVGDRYLQTSRPWVWIVLTFSTSRRWWQHLNATQQQIVREAATKAVAFTQTHSREEQGPAQAKLKNAAVEYYLVDGKSMQPWVDLAQPIWTDYEKRFGEAGKKLLALARS